MGVKSSIDEDDGASRSSTLPLALATSGRGRTDRDHTDGPPPRARLELLPGAARAPRGFSHRGSLSSASAFPAWRTQDRAPGGRPGFCAEGGPPVGLVCVTHSSPARPGEARCPVHALGCGRPGGRGADPASRCRLGGERRKRRSVRHQLQASMGPTGLSSLFVGGVPQTRSHRGSERGAKAEAHRGSGRARSSSERHPQPGRSRSDPGGSATTSA